MPTLILKLKKIRDHGLFEIRFVPSVPSKVSINEAVELAKTFGGDSSPKFVNGVLGSVMDEQDINGK